MGLSCDEYDQAFAEGCVWGLGLQKEQMNMGFLSEKAATQMCRILLLRLHDDEACGGWSVAWLRQ